ncbi:MAG: hypothetical protein V4692_06585 [Bdellovibrionota bacterium]
MKMFARLSVSLVILGSALTASAIPEMYLQPALQEVQERAAALELKLKPTCDAMKAELKTTRDLISLRRALRESDRLNDRELLAQENALGILEVDKGILERNIKALCR